MLAINRKICDKNFNHFHFSSSLSFIVMVKSSKKLCSIIKFKLEPDCFSYIIVETLKMSKYIKQTRLLSEETVKFASFLLKVQKNCNFKIVHTMPITSNTKKCVIKIVNQFTFIVMKLFRVTCLIGARGWKE